MTLVVRITLLLLLSAFTLTAATPEDEAKSLFEQWNAAAKAGDADALARLLAPDCVIIMTDPLAGAKHARFFTSESFIRHVRERFSQLADSTTEQTLHAVSAADTGDVFIIGETVEHSQLHDHAEDFRYSFYAVTHSVGGKMLFRFVVSQLTFLRAGAQPK
jgi:hypothetical protein